MSAMAWLVERVAGAFTGPVVVARLRRELSALSLPASLVPPAADPYAPYRPGGWGQP